MKKKILFQSDSALAKTGFGRNTKALLSYLYKTGKYEIVNFYCGTAYSAPVLQRTPWKSVGTLPDDQNQLAELNKDPGQARLASYGAHLIDKVINDEKPDVYFGVQDIWGTEFAVGKPWFDKINSVFELGCGVGSNLLPYYSKGKYTSGCDYNEDFLKPWRAQGLNLIIFLII